MSGAPSARKVAVIGAGFAGLGAARLLKQEARQHLDVTVLEGSQRVGGRACTLQVCLGLACAKTRIGRS